MRQPAISRVGTQLRRIRRATRVAVAALRRPASGAPNWAREELGLTLLEQIARRVLPGYLVTEYGRSWQADTDFLAAYRRLEPRSTRSADRKFALTELLKLTVDIPGDTAEIGVFRGASSWFICHGTQGSERTHYAVDSFAGLSQPSRGDGDYWRPGDLRAAEIDARTLLRDYDVTFVVGWVPEVLNELPEGPYAFVHVDVDLYEPTRAAFEFAYERMSPGGILLCDDYGFDTCPGARRAVDELMATRPEPVVHLPTGQGLVIRNRG
jgi:O-methyltransferase